MPNALSIASLFAVVVWAGASAANVRINEVVTDPQQDWDDSGGGNNILANDRVPQAMAGAFAADPSLHLGERLVRGLEAGLAASGEHGPVFSAVSADAEAGAGASHDQPRGKSGYGGRRASKR